MEEDGRWFAAPELQVLAGRLGADAALVTANPQAAVVLAVAAVLAAGDAAAVRRLPLVDGRPNGIVLQRAQMVTFGAPITQLLRLAGGKPHAIGTVDACGAFELQAALPMAAGALYVAAGQGAGRPTMSAAEMAWACHKG